MATKLKPITRRIAREIQQLEARRPPNPFTSACRHITKPQCVPIDTRIVDPKIGTRTKFAFISFDRFDPHDFKEDFIPVCPQHQRGLDIEACKRRLLKRHPRARADSWRHYQNALSEALDTSGVHIVVVNELGIPASSTGPPADFYRKTKSWARKTSSLIITGSFHDGRTKYNTGYIFTPDCPSDGYVLHKQVSATDIGEYISVPPKRQSVIVRAFGFSIGVIICIDLLDYSTVASLVDMRDAIDFVLVPSYSEAESMQSLGKIARVASQAMPGGVGIVNCHQGQTRSSVMHIFGESLDPVVDKRLSDGSGWLSIYEVDWHQFKTGKLRRQDIPRDLDWLFRYPVISRA